MVTGQTYDGNYEFVDTEMYLSINHEVAPRKWPMAWTVAALIVTCSGKSIGQVWGWER